jgi:hypothetical protein
MDAKSGANGVLAKDSKIAAIQNYNSYLQAMDFYTLRSHHKAIQRRRCGWDKGMMKLHDNFTNDFLYPNPATF